MAFCRNRHKKLNHKDSSHCITSKPYYCHAMNNSVILLVVSAKRYHSKHEYDKAAECYKAVYQYCSSNALRYMSATNVGRCCMQMEKYVDAIEFFLLAKT